jgi:3-dehydroquinate synthase
MNKFIIDKTTLTYPNTHGINNLSHEISSTPKSYHLNGFNSVEDLCNTMNTSLSEHGCLIIDRSVYDIFFKSKIYFDLDRIYFVDATENNKNIETVLDICSFYAKHNINKGSDIYVIGGGILQDLGGSASYLYKRGVPWSYIPSTLLGISDSCLGGKTAVNFKTYKNLLGLFSAPREVLLCLEFINTLSNQDLACGYGEIFRLSLTGGEESFKIFNDFIEASMQGNKEATKKLIISSLMVKKAVIEEDEYEINIRKSMNYGHTVGHAIEAISNFKIPHGIGVAIGILIENELSKNLDLMNPELCINILKSAKIIIDKKYIDILSNISFDDIDEHLRKDKKTIGNKANFTYLSKLGNMQFAYNDINTINKLIISSKEEIVSGLQD